MVTTRISRDPAYTNYHAWNIEWYDDGNALLTCSCGLRRRFSSPEVAQQALKIHMA